MRLAYARRRRCRVYFSGTIVLARRRRDLTHLRLRHPHTRRTYDVDWTYLAIEVAWAVCWRRHDFEDQSDV